MAARGELQPGQGVNGHRVGSDAVDVADRLGGVTPFE